LFNQRIISNDTFNIADGGNYYGINAGNCYNIMIQNNIFNMPSSSSYYQIGTLLKNNYSAIGTIEAAAQENFEPEIDGGYILNIVNNKFNNGAASLLVTNYTSNVLPHYITNNIFNYASKINLFMKDVNGVVKNNAFTSLSTPNAIHIYGGNQDFYKNNIKSSGVNMHLSGYCYPNLSPVSASEELIWSGGNNILESNNYDNVHLNTASNIFTNYGHNTFKINSVNSYNIYGLIQEEVEEYITLENCWLETGPHISLKHTEGSQPIPFRFYNFGFNCDRELVSPSEYDILNLGYGVYDTILASGNNSDTTQNEEDVLYEQSVEFLMNGFYTDAIINYKELIDNYPSSFYLETALYDLYFAYECLDTTEEQEYRNVLYGNLDSYLDDKIESELYNNDFEFIATELTAMCDANMEEYDNALNTYEFLALFHPDPDVRLMASWNYAEIEELLGSGGAEKDFELSEEKFLERIEKKINDDPKLSKLKVTCEKLAVANEKKIETDIRLKSKNEEEFQKSLKKATERVRIKNEKARRNLLELKHLNPEQLDYRRVEDIFMLSKNYADNNTQTDNASLPFEYKLNQNYPNPFNPSTTISYEIPAAGIISIKVYDLAGREVSKLVDEFQAAGRYELRFDGSNLSSGVYFYRIVVHSDKLSSGSYSAVKRMVLVK
ncbi:MAG: T9SS type A sorting domain-containing protein, partial [bacterium]